MQYVMPQDLKAFGLIPELVGRLPVLTYMQPLGRAFLAGAVREDSRFQKRDRRATLPRFTPEALRSL